MIIAGKMDWRMAFYRLSPADFSKTLQATVWASVRMKAADSVAPAPPGLRNTAGAALTEIRLRHRAGLQDGDYAVHGARLWHVVNVRDPDGKLAELIASAHELIGQPATYTPAGGAAVTTRAFVRHDAPFMGQMGQVVDYRTQIELPIFETGRAQRGDTVGVGARTYTLQNLAEDNGVTRTLWVSA